MVITSAANPKVKRLAVLHKKRKAREDEKVFLTEGIRMFREVPKELLKEIYVSESFYMKEQRLIEDTAKRSGIRPEIVSDQVYSRISDTQSPQGVLCVAAQRKLDGEGFDMQAEGKKPFFLILDHLQDPGNMGTVIRTAEAAGVNGIVLSKDCVDIYNPKTIRSTMGSIYRMPFWYVKDIKQAVCSMKERGIQVYAAHLEGTLSYDGPDYRGASAFLIGNEGNGLSEETAKLADTYIKIPMEGQVESLNAAIAAAVLMFEAGRQRRQDS